MSNEMMQQAIEMVEGGATKAKVEGFLIYMHDCSVNEAKTLAAKAFEKCGISTNAYSKAGWTETVKFLRENYGKLGKKELINGMCEVNGKTYKTNQHAYNYIAMAIEWAKQEVEAQK